MKFGYITTTNKEFVAVCRKGRPAFDFILKMTGIEPKYLHSVPVLLNENLIHSEIQKRLEERKDIKDDIPTYSGRFKEEEVFVYKEYNDIKLKLCTTGFDNFIIFLITLLESVDKTGLKHYFFYASNHREFTDYLNMNAV